MDSEERHELQQNDLREFLRNFRDWWDKNGTYLLLIVLIVVGGWVGWRWYSTKDIRQLESAWGEYAGMVAPEARQAIGEQYREELPGLASQAWLAAADQLLYQATIGMEGAEIAFDPTAAEPTEDQTERLMKAAGLYQLVLDLGEEAGRLHRVNAHMGLASVRAALGEWDRAREHYEAARNDAGPFRNIAITADRRLQRLEELRTPVTFPKAPADDEPQAPDDLPDTDALTPDLLPSPGEGDPRIPPMPDDEAPDDEAGPALPAPDLDADPDDEAP